MVILSKNYLWKTKMRYKKLALWKFTSFHEMACSKGCNASSTGCEAGQTLGKTDCHTGTAASADGDIIACGAGSLAFNSSRTNGAGCSDGTTASSFRISFGCNTNGISASESACFIGTGVTEV